VRGLRRGWCLRRGERACVDCRTVRRALASLLTAALVVCMADSGAAGAAGRTVALGPTQGPSVTVTADPVGLSVEYPVLAEDFGAGACPPPALASTIEGLGVPTIRIGGDSQDETAPAGTPPFAGVTDLSAAFWSQLACLEGETHEPFVIGLNVASQMPAWAATMAAGARSAIPSGLLSFEVGNEADIDGPAVPWWNATGQTRSLIPFSTYLDDAEAVVGQLGEGSDIEGPDFATGRWIGNIPQLVTALSLHTIDTHFYPLNACTGLAAATVAALLRPGASSLSSAVLATLAAARSVHLPMVISESNSVACRGKAGVSDSPAAAVWGLRLVLNAVRGGVLSVRFHSSGSSYDPFALAAGVVSTRPLYSGLETAVQLLPIGSVVTTLQTPSTMMGVLVAGAGGADTYIVTNYGKRPRAVSVVAKAGVRIVRVLDVDPVLVDQEAGATGGTATVNVAPGSVVAITPDA
jgi:hypothetical protein